MFTLETPRPSWGVFMVCNSFFNATWILLLYFKSEVCGDLVTFFLYSRSNAEVRTEIVFKVTLFSVRNIIDVMNEVAVKISC